MLSVERGPVNSRIVAPSKFNQSQRLYEFACRNHVYNQIAAPSPNVDIAERRSRSLSCNVFASCSR